jgi:outer membrane protein assembly factor BamB
MKNTTLATGVALVCALLLSACSIRAQDWPQWRGLNRDAKVTGFKVPATWPKMLKEEWRVKVGNGVATPALVGDKLFVFGREGGNEIVRCLDAATGKELWQAKYSQGAATGPSSSYPGPRSSPVVADGKVVTYGVSGTLSCFDAGNGNLLWRKTDYSDSLPRFFTACSPIVVEGLCIIQLGGEEEGAIVAYDLGTGAQKWKWDGAATGYSSPVVLTLDGKKVLVAITSESVVGIDPLAGTLLWKTPFRAGYNSCTPAADGEKIIFSGGARGSKPATKAIKIEKGGDKFAVKELWTNPDHGVQFNTPVVKNGLVFGLSASDMFFCINAESGKTAWSAPKGPGTGTSKPSSGGPGGRGGRGGRGGMMGRSAGFGSIVDAGSVLLALTPTMELIVFEPSDQKFTERARIKVANSPTFAYPVVSGNRLFVKDQDSVVLLTLE